MDPFSAATGVAGLISLGIEVCKGLNAYCRDYRGKDSDILTLSQHANRLDNFLHMIESRMNGSFQVDQALATTFEDCHATCTICLQDFAALKTKYARPKALSGLRQQGKAFVRQLQFPFQKDNFDSLRSQMLEFQNALSSYLLLLNCDRTTEVLHTTVSEAAKISSAIVLQGQRTTDQISVLLPQIDRSIDDRLSRLEQLVLSRSDKEPEATDLRVQGQETTISVDDRHNSRTTGISFDHSRQSTETPLSGSDPALKSYSQSHQQLGERSPSMLSNFVCICKNDARKVQHDRRSPEILEHKEICPFFFLNKKKRTISGEIRVFSTLFRWKVSIRYSQLFLGDLQVQPNLTLTAIHDNSPAFELIDSLDIFDRQMTENEVDAKLSVITRGLRQLFMDRKAWPTDVSRYGENILHRACSRNLSRQRPNNTHHLFRKFLAVLVSMGVPINQDGRLGTPLGCFLRSQEDVRYGSGILQRRDDCHNGSELSISIVRELVSRGAVHDYGYSRYSRTPLVLPAILPYFGDILHCFEYGELSSALILRSAADVRRLLSHSVEYMFEKGHRGDTPLHISASWPQGLTILFELANDACASIIDAEDRGYLTPLDHAIHLDQVESAAFLLKQNAAIDLEFLVAHIPWRRKLNEVQNKDVCDLLAKTLVNRRASMLQHAIEHLPELDVVRFNLRSMTFLQETAFDVVESLKSSTAQLPATFDGVRPGTVYHLGLMSDILAESLYEAGFRNVDAPLDGYTPIMVQNYEDLRHAIGLITWFDQRQADLLAVIPSTLLLPSTVFPPGPLQFRVIHRLASILGYFTTTNLIDEFWSSFSSDYICLAGNLLSKSCQDPCRCYCAPKGCNATSLFAKSFIKSESEISYISSKWVQDRVDEVFDFTALEVISEAHEDVQTAFVRVCTFDRLNMRHTCCEHDPWGGQDIGNERSALVKLMDHSEVEEIQEEDRYLAETLQELMIEFESRLKDETQSFRDFWKWWNERMNEVDEEIEPRSSEDAAAWADIGVHLEM